MYFNVEPKKYLEEYVNPDKRATFCEFFSLTADETSRLLLACRDNGNEHIRTLLSALPTPPAPHMSLSLL